VTAAARAAGHSGGEGGQVVESIAIDSTGKFLMMGTDVGGFYRSLDGGAHWEPANVGIGASGVRTIAIDPNASDRVVMVATNGYANLDYIPWGGLWLSTDRGRSWSQQLSMPNVSDFDRNELAWDPTSLSGGMSKVAYWSSHGTAHGFYKTIDGGVSWNKLHDDYAFGSVAVHPTLGHVYVGNDKGFFRSEDGGQTFSQTAQGSVTGVGVTPAQPGFVAITKDRAAWTSNDAGMSFKARASSGLPTYGTGSGIYGIRVNPMKPNYMIAAYDSGDYWDQNLRYSHDGGDTWASPTSDNTNVFLSPWGGDDTQNAKGRVWHPTDPDVLFALGDWVSKSTDAGVHMFGSNDGNNGILMAAHWSFNPSSPNLLAVGFQDWVGALSFDGGDTWTGLEPGSAPRANGYGGYAFSKSRMFIGFAPEWSGPRSIYTSADGGRTWVDTGHASSDDMPVTSGDPANPDGAFWCNWRTADQGATWEQMSGCDRVFAYNPSGDHALYGTHGSTVVKSTDHGVSWSPVFDALGKIHDLAYDHAHNRIYATVGNNDWDSHLVHWEAGKLTDITARLPADSDRYAPDTAHSASSVAVDPIDPNVVYAGRAPWLHQASIAVMRSTDAGATWTALTKQPGDTGIDGGGHNTVALSVHPGTRYVWVAAGCQGIWKHPPP